MDRLVPPCFGRGVEANARVLVNLDALRVPVATVADGCNAADVLVKGSFGGGAKSTGYVAPFMSLAVRLLKRKAKAGPLTTDGIDRYGRFHLLRPLLHPDL